MTRALDVFGPATALWFRSAFAQPTAVQEEAWAAIDADHHALVVAPTGSGKTLAAFLWAIDRLYHPSSGDVSPADADAQSTAATDSLSAHPLSAHSTSAHPSNTPAQRQSTCTVLYVSPLKALAADVQRNLRSPLVGIRQAAARAGMDSPDIKVGMRSGDTPQSERRSFASAPPDILVTTPESLYLILTSSARVGLAGVRTVILDEIHAVAGTKRGAHLAVSLERLDDMLVKGGTRPAQRIGLSATVEPVDVVASFLRGNRPLESGGRDVTVVQPPAHKDWDINLVVPVPDLTNLDTPVQGGQGLVTAGQDPVSIGETLAKLQADQEGEAGTSAAFIDLTRDAAGPLGGPCVDLSGNATGAPRKASIWPHVEERIVDLITAHKSTLVFTNSRQGAERLTSRINEIWALRNGFDVPDSGSQWPAQYPSMSGTAASTPLQAPLLARPHHGSMSHSERALTESALKAGELPAVVATSSLELGIDMGAVDLVIQVGAPPSAASGLQRIGRAGHQVGATSRGSIFPTHRGDLIPATVVVQRMLQGELEPLHIIANPLDILAQQVVAALAVEDWHSDQLRDVMRMSAPFTTLGDATWAAVLDMLAGRYPSEAFAELKPRIVWDRMTGILSARPGALRLAVTSGGTIPDRGMYRVVLAGGEDDASLEALSASGGAGSGPRGGQQQRGGKTVGELDEEMVYETRIADTITLGSSTWRVEEITPDRVIVTPAPGLPGRLPFWKGEGIGRSIHLGRAIGQFTRTLDTALTSSQAALPDGTAQQLLARSGLDPWAADNLISYITEQRLATGHVPDDQTIVVERFTDELGDWRLVIHSPFGARVHAPWALVIASRLRERYGIDVSAMHHDDGIVLRLPATDGDWDIAGGFAGDGFAGGNFAGSFADTGSDGLADGSVHGQPVAASGHEQVSAVDLLLDPVNLQQDVQEDLGASVMFAARFREAAARALLLPNRMPGKRQPLWQQRQRSAQLLQVAAQFPTFPIILEAARECLQDVFDVESLRHIMQDIEAGRIRVVEVTTTSPSPFAQSLLFGYTAQFLYDGDAPLAERKAAALALDPDLLMELLGDQGVADIADLLDVDAVERTEAELQFLTPGRQAAHHEALWDVLRRTGPHTLQALEARSTNAAAVAGWLSQLEEERRVICLRIADCDHWAVIDDAGRLRDALGAALPIGIPEAYTEILPDPLGDLVRRHLRSHGPVSSHSIAVRYGLGRAVVEQALTALESSGHAARGALRPSALGGHGDEWCDVDVLRTLRRRSLAALRAEVEPVEPLALGLFLPEWQHVGWYSASGSSPGRTGEHVGAAKVASSGSSPGPAGVGSAGVGVAGGQLRGRDGLLTVISQLAGAPVPASALETLILPARIAGYQPHMLDELTSMGEVVWCGHSRLPGSGGGDGMISLHLADDAPLTLPKPQPLTDSAEGSLAGRILEVLQGTGGYFIHQLAARIEAPVHETLDSLWELVWAGWVTNDSLAPLRQAVGSGAGGAHRAPAAPGRARPLGRPRLARSPLMLGTTATSPSSPQASPISAATGLSAAGGRWSLLPAVHDNATVRAHGAAHVLLDRHGVLTRAVGTVESIVDNYRDVYRVLRGLEERGAIRRGYFVESLGGSQFALPGAVDQLRQLDQQRSNRAPGHAASPPRCVLLAAMDPANPYGAALPWPSPQRESFDHGARTAPDQQPHQTLATASSSSSANNANRPGSHGAESHRTDLHHSGLYKSELHKSGLHRPGRKAGAVVVLVDGELVFYVERGGRTLVSFTDQHETLQLAAAVLAQQVSAGRLGKVVITKVNGHTALSSARDRTPTAAALLAAGFGISPQGLRTSTAARPYSQQKHTAG